MARWQGEGSPLTLARRLFGIDARSLALFRIGLALFILADLALRVGDLGAFFTDEGVLPKESILAHYPPAMTVWSLYLLGGSAAAQGTLLLVQALCAALLLVGFRTRLMAAVSWMFLVSLDVRNPLVIQGGDTLAQLMLFWGMFVPLGAAFSVDRALAPAEQGEPGAQPILSTGTIALLAQVFVLYYFAGLHKHQSLAWRDGTAIAKTLAMPEMVHGSGAFLASHPGLLTALTHAVLYFEIAGPFLLFCPWMHVPVRAAALAGFVGLQLGLASCLKLGLFPFISTLVMVLFVPGEIWARLPWIERTLTGASTWIARAWARLSPGSAVFHPGPVEAKLVAFLALYAAIWNVGTLDREFLDRTARRRIPLFGRAYRPPSPLLWPGFMLKLNQAMTMFVLPDATSHWNEVRVTFRDGTASEFGLDRGSLRPAGEVLPSRLGLLRFRWGGFWATLPGHPWAHTHAGAYVCRQYRREHGQGPAPAEIKIYSAARTAGPDGSPGPVRRRLLLSHLCAVEDGALEP
jgi:hypothetical protein